MKPLNIIVPFLTIANICYSESTSETLNSELVAGSNLSRRSSSDTEEFDAPNRRVFILPSFKVPDIGTFRAQAYATQNCYRDQHGARPLSASSQLESFAQNWADNLARSNSFEHSQGQYGENLYADSNSRMDGTSAIRAWYSEGRNYNYNADSGFSGTGHFTQVVWKGSRSCGISYAKSPRWTIVVAEYDPPGNFVGNYVENVGRPSGPNRDCVGEGQAAGGGGGSSGGMGPDTEQPEDNMGGGGTNDMNGSPSPQRPPPSRPPSGRPPSGRPPSGRPPSGRPPSGRPPSNRPPWRPPNPSPNRPSPYISPDDSDEDEEEQAGDGVKCEGWKCRITSVKIETLVKNTTTFFLEKKR